MRKILSLSAVAVALAVATSANAAVIVTVTNLGAATDSFGDPATGYTAYLISAQSDNGANITAVDMGGTVGSPYTGITGPLLQEWDTASGRSGTTVTPTPVVLGANGLNGGTYGLDSHWLFVGDTIDSPPTEDNDQLDPPGSPPDVTGASGENWGTGTSLLGAVGLNPSHQVSTLNLAYVVLPSAAAGAFDINIADSNQVGWVDVGTIGPASGTTPEPASLGLLALGGLALLRRRRKA